MVYDKDDNAITLGWRFRQLLAAQLEIEQTLELAEDPAVDVHRVVELTQNGCPPHLAVRIVAPLTYRFVQRKPSIPAR
jgi:hypothetical protein